MRPRWVLAGAACLAAVVAVSCGKKGNPLPPLRPVPARITDMAVVRTAGQIELRLTVPAANLDGSTPVVIDRVDIFAAAAVADAPSPSPQQIAATAGAFRGSLPVQRLQPANGSASPPAPSTEIATPGSVAVFVDRVSEAEQGNAEALYYVAVPVAGSGRGRPGPPTTVATVPLGPLPWPPADLTLVPDEAHVRATWQPDAAIHAFHVYRVTAGGEDTRLTPSPLSSAEFSLPVEFGREMCVSVRAVQVDGAVSVEGPASAPVCLTPVDRYPPPAPARLRVVQEGSAVTLIWDAVQAADLAGYVVLRGAGNDGTLAPLMREPIRETTYRDTTGQAGVTYTYAVYAVDTASEPNTSELSARETITLR